MPTNQPRARRTRKRTRRTRTRKIAGKKPERNTLTSKVNRLITIQNKKTNWLQYEVNMNDSNTNLASSSVTSYKNVFCRNIIRPTTWDPIFQSEGNVNGAGCKEYEVHSLRVSGVINLNTYEGEDQYFTIALVSPKGPLAEQTRDRLQAGTGGLKADEDYAPLAQYGTGTGASSNPTLIMLNRKKFHIHFLRKFYMSTVNQNVGAVQAGIEANLSNQKRFFRKYIKFNKVLRNQEDDFLALDSGDLNPKSTLWLIGFSDTHNLTPSANTNPHCSCNVIINGRARD